MLQVFTPTKVFCIKCKSRLQHNSLKPYLFSAFWLGSEQQPHHKSSVGFVCNFKSAWRWSPTRQTFVCATYGRPSQPLQACNGGTELMDYSVWTTWCCTACVRSLYVGISPAWWISQYVSPNLSKCDDFNMELKLLSVKCQAIVRDGLSMGWPCCGVFRCQDPLQNNRHRFCTVHFRSHDICAVVGCDNPVLEVTTVDPIGGLPKAIKTKTCSLSVHQQMEKKHDECSTSSFLYRDRKSVV